MLHRVVFQINIQSTLHTKLNVRPNSWVILKSSLKKKLLNAYCTIGRIAHGNAFRCALLDSKLWTTVEKARTFGIALQQRSIAFAHAGWPFVFICVACAFTITPSFPLHTGLAKCWTIFFFVSFTRPKNESNEENQSYCRKNKANIITWIWYKQTPNRKKPHQTS